MSKFTKGKWKYLHNLYQVVSYPENEPIFYDGNAQALWHEITGELNIGLNNSEEEANANGRLIAAAPEMYELLKVCAKTETLGNYVSAFLDLKNKARELLARIDVEEDKHD